MIATVSQHYKIVIPVKPYIQKFYHPVDGSAILPKFQPMLWLIIKPYLQYKVKDGLSKKERKDQVDNLKGQITIKVSMSKVRLYGMHVSPTKIILINKVLDHLFGRELYHYVSKCEANTGRYKGFYKTIEDFCRIHNISIGEDISKESLLNLYKRHRDRYLSIISSRNVSPEKKEPDQP